MRWEGQSGNMFFKGVDQGLGVYQHLEVAPKSLYTLVYTQCIFKVFLTGKVEKMLKTLFDKLTSTHLQVK